MRLSAKFLLLMLGLWLGSVAVAASSDDAEFGALRARQTQIGLEVAAATPPYDGMPAHARTALLERQTAVLKLIEGKRGAEDLEPQQQAELAEALKWIDRAIASAEDNRQVCELRKVIGSNRRERVCTTVGQQREQREAARREMEIRAICSGPGCS